MTEKTTVDKLRSLKRHVQNDRELVDTHQGSRLRRPSELPPPNLPDQSWLETTYLAQIAISAPELLDEVKELVAIAKANRT